MEREQGRQGRGISLESDGRKGRQVQVGRRNWQISIGEAGSSRSSELSWRHVIAVPLGSRGDTNVQRRLAQHARGARRPARQPSGTYLFGTYLTSVGTASAQFPLSRSARGTYLFGTYLTSVGTASAQFPLSRSARETYLLGPTFQ